MDRMLLDRAISGDAAAFEELLASCEKLIIRTCRHFMGNKEDTEDAVIEAEAMLWNVLDTYTEDESFEGFAFRITQNICRNMLKSMRAKKRGKNITVLMGGMRVGEDEDLTYDPPDPTQDTEEQVIRKEETRYFRECMQALPEEQHNALWLTKVEGYKYTEAAEMLKISEGTVKSQVKRAREKLKTMWEKLDSGPDNEPDEPVDINTERRIRR